MEQLGIYSSQKTMPLAYEKRPDNLDDFYGQEKSIEIIKKMIAKKELVNLIIYGPPGVGKTTISKIIAKELSYNFEELNAVKVGTTAIKEVSIRAKEYENLTGKKTILLFDEIHRFNKAQQDSLLLDLEDGNLILIGTTTENPYYSLNKAILSRSIVLEFKKLKKEEIKNIVLNVAKKSNIQIDEEIQEYILSVSQGDARQAINILELISKTDFDTVKNSITIQKRYDENDKYERISAMIKSIRGSDPDASIYWLASMLISGEDISYIARRLVILASEDIGLANPNALNIAVSAMNAVEKIGMPEARIILAECAVYLALSPKSNSSYNAINSAFADISRNGVQDVPFHLTKNGKMKYKYSHSYPNSYVEQDYMNKKIKFYEYGDNKIEKKMKEYWNKIKGDINKW